MFTECLQTMEKTREFQIRRALPDWISRDGLGFGVLLNEMTIFDVNWLDLLVCFFRPKIVILVNKQFFCWLFVSARCILSLLALIFSLTFFCISFFRRMGRKSGQVGDGRAIFGHHSDKFNYPQPGSFHLPTNLLQYGGKKGAFSSFFIPLLLRRHFRFPLKRYRRILSR